ncbi:hypothetical protein PG997_014976 [Apiospora hydei]|uniref:2EXR domain-containing protein n=1 Tax=Apiospora hydei TaxID=1337664 RepID=A0ABR1UVB5_9PEZI
MSTFPQFSRLAPELRMMIWKEALKNETQDRIALVHRDSLRIVPSKSLVSPLMAVNQESREVALTYFDVRLDIVRLTLDVTVQDTYSWATTRPADWENHVRNEIHIAAHAALISQPNGAQPGTPKGSIYLNSHLDTFLLSFNQIAGNRRGLQPLLEQHSLRDCCLEVLTYAKIAEELGPSALQEHEVPHPYVSARLPTQACRRIANVVYAAPHYDLDLKPWPGKVYYSSDTVATLWMTQIFHQMRGGPAGAAGGAPYRTLEDVRQACID